MTLYANPQKNATIIFTKTVSILSSEYIINFGVHRDQIESLGDYLLRICNEQNISFREVVRRAERKGYDITHGYISRIVSGAAQNISVDKLQALAAGLNRPEEEVFAVARGGRTEEKIKDAAASALLYKYQQLSDRDKTEIETLLRALDREIEDRLAKKK